MSDQIRPFIACVIALCSATGALAQPQFGGKHSTPPPKVRLHDAPTTEETPYAPIPLSEAAKTSPLTEADTFERCLAVEKRWMVDSYLKNGDLDAKLDDRVVHFLEQAAVMYCGPSMRVVPKALGHEGLKLLEDGCKDPLVMWVAFFLGKESGVHQPKLEDMGLVLDLLTTTKHTPARNALFARWLMEQYQAAGSRAGANRAFAVLSEQLTKAVGNPDMDPMEQRYLVGKFSRLGDEVSPDELESITRQVLETKGAPQWVRLMFGGHYQVKAAWEARGSGWAETVSPEAWREFDEHLRIAQNSFEQAHMLAPQHPDAAASMIVVAMGGRHAKGQPVRYWFDQAVKAQIDEPEAYSNYLTAILPRWGGSSKEMVRFGIECASVHRPDALCRAYAVNAVERVSEDLEDFTGPWLKAGIRDLCIQALEEAIANPKYAQAADMYRTKLAAIAVRSGSWDVGRRALDGLGQPLLAEYADAYRLLPEDIQYAILARTEASTRNLVLSADRKTEAGDYQGALEDMKKARFAPTTSITHARAIHDILEQTRIRAELRGTEWVNLCANIDTWIPGWRVRDKSQWNVYSTGVQHMGYGRGFLTMQVPVGDRFEFEASVLFAPKIEDWQPRSSGDSSPGGAPSQAQSSPAAGLPRAIRAPQGSVGLAVGCDWNRRTDGAWIAALLDASSQQAVLGIRNQPRNPVHAAISIDAPVRMRVVRFDDTLTVQVNGRTTYNGPVPTESGWRAGPYIGLMVAKDSAFGSPGFRDVRVRRLEERPGDLRTASVPTP